MPEDRTFSISITFGTVIKILFVLAGAWLVYELFDVVLVMLMAIVIASAIEPMARSLMKRKIPRTVAVLLVYILFLGGLFGMLYLFVPLLLSETANFVAALPSYAEHVQHITPEYSPILSATGANPSASITGAISQLQALVTEFSQNIFAAASAIFGGLLSFILILVFSFYFSIQERGIEDFLRIVTPFQYEDYVIGLWRRAQTKIGLWMQGQLILGIFVGVLVFLVLTILGIKHALVLAVIAALFEIIPIVGPTLSAVPAVFVGFVDGGITVGILVIAAYAIIQQFENHLIYPLVVSKVVGVPPLFIILGLIIGAKLAGVIGILLSAPIAAVLQEFVSDLERHRIKRVSKKSLA